MALKARPSRQLVVKLRTLTLGYPAVFIWHHSNKASLADLVSLLSTSSIMMSWIWQEGENHLIQYSTHLTPKQYGIHCWFGFATVHLLHHDVLPLGRKNHSIRNTKVTRLPLLTWFYYCSPLSCLPSWREGENLLSQNNLLMWCTTHLIPKHQSISGWLGLSAVYLLWDNLGQGWGKEPYDFTLHILVSQ